MLQSLEVELRNYREKEHEYTRERQQLIDALTQMRKAAAREKEEYERLQARLKDTIKNKEAVSWSRQGIFLMWKKQQKKETETYTK